MEIQALSVVLTETDLNSLIQKLIPKDTPIEDLRLTLGIEGAEVTGVYPLFINVQFVTRWGIEVETDKVVARLLHAKALGVPLTIFKSAIVKMIHDLAQNEPWIRMDGDAIYVDVDACIAKYAFPARTHLKRISIQAGQITILGGP